MTNQQCFPAMRIMVLLLCAASSAWAQQAPELSDEILSAEGALDAAQRGAVDRFLEYHTGQFIAAEAPAEIIASRQAVVEAFNSGAEGLKSYYPDAVARIWAPPALASPEPLKQVNGALVVFLMKRPAVTAVLGDMAGHANPAVRYYAAATYRDIRYQLLAQGPQAIDAMCSALESLAGNGRPASAPTMQAIFAALDLVRPNEQLTVSPSDLTQAQARARQAFERLVPMQLQGVRDGKAGWIQCYRQAATTGGAMYENILNQQKTGGLTALAAILTNAGAAYLDLADRADDQNAEVLGTLLVECEQAIARITGESINAVASTVNANDPEPAAVLLEVNQLVGVEGSPGQLNQAPWNVPIPTRLGRTPARTVETASGQ